MRKLIFVVLFLWHSIAYAQISTPLRILNAGTQLQLEYKLNFVNGGCVVNAGQNRIDCTFGAGGVTSITGSTGITAAPNPIIGVGTLTVDQSFSPTWTGVHVFSGNGITEQQSGLGTSTTTSGVLVQNTTASLVGAQQQYAPLIEQCGHGWQAGAVNADQLVCHAWQERPQPGVALAATPRLALAGKYGGNAYQDSLFVDTDTTNVTQFSYAGGMNTNVIFGASLNLHSSSGIIRPDSMWPVADGDQLGEPTIPLGWVVAAKASYARLQTPAFAVGMNFDPSLGEHIKVVITANMGNWTITAPPAGANNTRQIVMLEIVQPAAGGPFNIGTPPASVKFLPTAYRGTTHTATTLSSAANAKDYIFLVSDNDAGTWIEIAENLNN